MPEPQSPEEDDPPGIEWDHEMNRLKNGMEFHECSAFEMMQKVQERANVIVEHDQRKPRSERRYGGPLYIAPMAEWHVESDRGEENNVMSEQPSTHLLYDFNIPPEAPDFVKLGPTKSTVTWSTYTRARRIADFKFTHHIRTNLAFVETSAEGRDRKNRRDEVIVLIAGPNRVDFAGHHHHLTALQVDVKPVALRDLVLLLTTDVKGKLGHWVPTHIKEKLQESATVDALDDELGLEAKKEDYLGLIAVSGAWHQSPGRVGRVWAQGPDMLEIAPLGWNPTGDIINKYRPAYHLSFSEQKTAGSLWFVLKPSKKDKDKYSFHLIGHEQGAYYAGRAEEPISIARIMPIHTSLCLANDTHSQLKLDISRLVTL
ncbi:hypothetical protein T439DRAFT_322710 [Meredithblackwellia eburnea MCA 4105]